MHKERNFGLDLLRAIAISLVIASHCTYFFVEDSNNSFVVFIRVLGAVGVDLFFILSGFLIGGLLLRDIEINKTKFSDLLTFWKRRWFRTLPNYFLMLFVNICIFWLFAFSLPKNLGSYFLFLQNFSTPHPVFFTEAWSLSIEEFAYLILPLIMFSAFPLFKNNKKSIFLLVTLVIIGLGYLLKFQYYLDADINSYKDWSSGFRKVVIYRLNAVYVGFVLVFIMRQFSEFFKKFRIGFLVLGLLLFSSVHILIYAMKLQPQTHLAFYVFWYLPLISISCGLLFPGVLYMKRPLHLHKLVHFVSTRSYAMYVVNFSAILLSIQYLFQNTNKSIFISSVLCLLYLILTVILSNILYVYFERPILKFRDKKYY